MLTFEVVQEISITKPRIVLFVIVFVVFFYTDIMVMKTINSILQPNGDVSISYEISRSDCADFILEFIEINTDTRSRSIIRTTANASTVHFIGRDPAAQYMCAIYLVLPSMHEFELESFICSGSKFLCNIQRRIQG